METGAGSLEMLAKTSCFLFKLWIPSTNWNGLHVFGIRYRIALPLSLQNRRGKKALSSEISKVNLEEHSSMDFPDWLSSLLECVILLTAVPIAVWVAASIS